MPDRDVTFIGDLIDYQYAKIVAKSAFAASDGREAKGRAWRVSEADFEGIGAETKVNYLLTNVPWGKRK